MARVGGLRRKKVSRFTKTRTKKGKVSLRSYLSEFKEGDRVSLTVEPAIQKGMYCPRFVGKSGTVIGKTGDCYKVQIEDLKKTKTLIVHPVHMRMLK